MSSQYAPDLQSFVDNEWAKAPELDAPLPFSAEEYADRLGRLQRAMVDSGVDVVVLMAPEPMAWLHGYASRVYEYNAAEAFPVTHATIVHAESGVMFQTDSAFHEELVRRTSCITDFRGLPETGLHSSGRQEDYNAFLVDQLRAEGWLGGVVGLELRSGVPSPAISASMADALREAGCQVVDATSLIREVRRIKSPAEIGYIERAAAACDAGLLRLRTEGRAGMTELEAWAIYMAGVTSVGGEPTAIHETVAVGPPAARLHSWSSRRPIQRGENFHPDMSAAYEHYHARATRPFSIGTPPPELTALTAIVAGAYDVVESEAKVGMTYGELGRILKSYYLDAGVGDDESFAGGYELGLSFPPNFVGEFVWGTGNLDDERPIEAGFVTNFESIAHVTIIDTLLFEESGARFLSKTPREVGIIE